MKVRWLSVLVAMGIAGIYLAEIGPERLFLSDTMTTLKSNFAEVAMPLYATLETLMKNESMHVAVNITPVQLNIGTSSSSTNASLLSKTIASVTTKAVSVNPLNDQTIAWNTTMPRPWLDDSAKKPPAMILLTNFGWNHPNQTFGIRQYRGLRTVELVEGIVNHEYFHPTAWEELNSGSMEISETTRYYIFLDEEHCGTYQRVLLRLLACVC